ncbi:hypothetical protein AB0K08_06095 [Citricoccus sp. NPDC055426]|uniref:hypothetical protein n=1 Tax=Citricoccus sp. NPDC055426 TaxID=3155536 RepID=UPI003440DA44
MSSGAIGALIFLFLTAVAAAFLLAFAAAYRGRWLQWLMVSPPGLPSGRYWGLYMMAFFGAGTLVTGAYAWLVMGLYGTGDDSPLWITWTWIGLIAVLAIVGIVSSFWLPRRLKPRWLLDWEDAGADTGHITATVRLRRELRREHRRRHRAYRRRKLSSTLRGSVTVAARTRAKSSSASAGS